MLTKLSVSLPFKLGSWFPASLIQPDQEDNGWLLLTAVLRKKAENTLKVNKLQDSHTLLTREERVGGGKRCRSKTGIKGSKALRIDDSKSKS